MSDTVFPFPGDIAAGKNLESALLAFPVMSLGFYLCLP